MAYKISEKCISCGACAAQCPMECIKQGDGKYEIDENVCISCGTCASSDLAETAYNTIFGKEKNL